MTISAAPSVAPLGRERMGSFARLLGPLAALAAVVLFFGVSEFGQLVSQYRRQASGPSFLAYYREQGTFFTAQNGRNILVQAAPVGVAALGMTVIIIAAGIDLSAGTAVALSAVALAQALVAG